jgi:GntR family transcriptional regulator
MKASSISKGRVLEGQVGPDVRAGASTAAATEPAASPKYQRLRDEVMDIIESLPTGAAIPSERELSSRLGSSRMTLRRAIDELARDGYLIRRRGAGTFTARPKILHRLRVMSFTEDMARRGLTSSSRTLSSSVHPAGARLGARLRVSPEAAVLTVGRLRLANDEPMAIEWLSVPQAVVPGLRGEDLADRSFYQLLTERYRIEIAGGTQTMEPTVTDENDSRLLDVPIHSPALFVERVTWTESHQVIEFVQSIYRGDRYRFEVELEPLAPARKRQ